MKPSNSTFKLVASPVFRISLNRFKAFLNARVGDESTTRVVENIKSRLKEDLEPNPYLAPISERLLALGLNEYRLFMIDEHNLVIYRVDELQHEIVLLLIMDSRQSLRKLLFEVNLLMN